MIHTKQPLIRIASIATLLITIFTSICICSKAAAVLLEIPLRYRSIAVNTYHERNAQAIVILTGPNAEARLNRAAEIGEKTKLPIMICGSGAINMEKTLHNQHGILARWIEYKSADTYENAKFCAPILRRSGVMHILLVTDEYHTWRARSVFEWAGFIVTPMPSSLIPRRPISALDFLPSIEGYQRVRIALHEVVGMTWYSIRKLLQ